MACTVCSGTCYTSCTSGCTANCQDDCTAACASSCTTGCSDACALACSTGCGDTCTGACGGNCTGTCSDTCTGACGGDCTGTCSTTCEGTCVGGCVLACAYSAAGDSGMVIKFKRTTKAPDNQFVIDAGATFGEPLYFKTKKWLTVGDGDNATNVLPVVKFVSQSIADKGLFYNNLDSSSYADAITDSGATVYPKTKVGAITDADNVSLTTLLANKEATITTLPVSKGGTGFNTIPIGSIPVGNGTGAMTQRPITTSVTSGSTDIITSGGVYSKIDGLHYAGSTANGGAANSVKTSLTFNNGGSGSASGTTFDGSVARTISYNTVGAAASSHTHNYAGSSSAGGSANSVKASLTFNNGGSGAGSGTTFNGSEAKTISYNTIGAAASNHTHSYAGSSSAGGAATALNVNTTTSNTNYYILGASGTGSQNVYRALNTSASKNTSGVYFNGATGVLYGAAWNDFAEFRRCKESAGTTVVEDGNGGLVKSVSRLQGGASVVSDTYGMVIGNNDEGYTPVAVAGRVLVYMDKTITNVAPGDAVCTGENGTVSRMTREEIKEYPDRIVGYLSEFPSYKEWNGVEVNGRVWIKIK